MSNYSTLDKYMSFLHEPKENYNELDVKTVFLTFANDAYKNSVERMKEQANLIPFDTRLIYNENNLKSIPEFWNKHGTFIENNPRGYGYWIWKPFLVLHTLRSMKHGQVLIYADSGSSMSEDVDSFKDIVRRVSSSPSGILSWKLNHRERTWTKYDLIDHLNAQHVWEKDDYQLHATFFALRCCEPMIKLIEKWYNTASNYHLVDDTPSILANDESFKEHRHDQSIFSILRNLYGTDLYEGGFLLDTKTRG